MLSIVIPTLNAARTLKATLATLAEADGAGLSHEIIVSDGGSSDDTTAAAARAGARVVIGPPGRGAQLAAGAAVATGDWLLFMHADTHPQPGWTEAVCRFCADPANASAAGYFRFALDDDCVDARRVQFLVRLRCHLFALPYGDQGLLITRKLYDALGGFRALPLMEDVEIVRRLGRARLRPLRHDAVTSAERYRRDGWWHRPLRNLACLALYLLGVEPKRLLRIYR